MTLAGAVAWLDGVAAEAVWRLRSPALTLMMRVVTELGSWWFVSGLIVAVSALIWTRRGLAQGAFVAIPVAGATLLSSVSKAALGRIRPPQESALIALPASKSLPSGHAMASFVVAAVLIYLVRRWDIPPAPKVVATVAAVLYACGVAFSRVYLGVHWASDVIASWVLAGAWLWIVVTVYARQNSRTAEAGMPPDLAERVDSPG